MSARNIGGNVALFVPFGFFYAAWRPSPRPVRAASVAASCLAVTVEVVQALAPLGRAADVDDAIFNVCGAAVGAACYLLAVKPSRRLASRDREPAPRG